MTIIQSDGIDIHYDVFRNGAERPWIVFAHGAGGNAASWFQQVPHFYERYDVITFDHRGFGRSRCTETAFDSSRFVVDLERILDAEGIARAILCCQSMGGRTGLDLALKSPDRVHALIMSHTVGAIATPAIAAARDATDAPAPKAPFGSWAVAHDLPDKNETLAHLYNCIGRANVSFESFGGVGALRGKAKTIGADALDGYTVPTLFVTADNDVVIPPPAVEIAAELLPGATLVNLGDAGHSSYFEIADDFNAAVDHFLLGVPTS